jgi:hypothetical protein
LTEDAAFASLARARKLVTGENQTPEGTVPEVPSPAEPANAAASVMPSVGATPPASTTPAGAPDAEPVAAALGPLPRPGVLRRVVEWFWRGRAMAELRESSKLGPPRAAALAQRGWVALDVVARALAPSERFVNGPPNGVSWELSRQSLYWGLRAERVRATGTDTHVDPGELATLFHEGRTALLATAGTEGDLETIASFALDGSFADFAELSLEEQGRRAHALAAFSRAFLTDLERPRVHLDRLWFQRLWRTGLAVLVLLAAVLGPLLGQRLLERKRDVARDKPWTTSSAYAAVTVCKSPEQDCPESPFYFFHTMDEERPWVEVDLGAKQRIRAVRIKNREDCCGDRAVPLVVQVSTDHKSWKEVARRKDVFGNWYAEFKPTSARWVRVQATRRTILHLHRVSVLR